MRQPLALRARASGGKHRLLMPDIRADAGPVRPVRA